MVVVVVVGGRGFIRVRLKRSDVELVYWFAGLLFTSKLTYYFPGDSHFLSSNFGNNPYSSDCLRAFNDLLDPNYRHVRVGLGDLI